MFRLKKVKKKKQKGATSTNPTKGDEKDCNSAKQKNNVQTKQTGRKPTNKGGRKNLPNKKK